MSKPASDATAGEQRGNAHTETGDASGGTGDFSGGTDETLGTTTDSVEASTEEYEHLRTKRKERQGNTERATVRDVFVGEREVVLTAAFDWTTDTERFVYDLDSDRDVLELEALAESAGFDFEQVSFLEGESLAVVYTGTEWVPEAHLAAVESQGSARETFRTELRLLSRELARSPNVLRRLVRLSRNLTTKQLVIAVVLVKKLLVVALVAWLVL